jgi:hypothetical protein
MSLKFNFKQPRTPHVATRESHETAWNTYTQKRYKHWEVFDSKPTFAQIDAIDWSNISLQ